MEDIEREIVEANMMIDHFIMLGNKEEIRYWRGGLQSLKVMKRRIKTS